MSQAVLDVLGSVLFDMGAGDDPECWVAWGDDPEFKYSVLAPTAAGLVTVAVRLNAGGDGGPRATAKLVRWSKLQVGEFAIEAADGHRVVAVQVEGLVLKGTDDLAGRICEFVRGLMAGADGRAFVASGPVVVQTVPVSATTATAKGPAGPGKAAPPPAAPAPPAKGGRKGGKAPRPEPEPEPAEEAELDFVAPHPITVADEPIPVPKPAPVPPPAPAPAQPTPPVPQPAPQPAGPAAGFGQAQPRPATREPGSVWEIPAGDPSGRDQKKARTWRP